MSCDRLDMALVLLTYALAIWFVGGIAVITWFMLVKGGDEKQGEQDVE